MKYVTGNLLESNAAALVNAVNTVGVMGKGIALQFKERFPLNFKVYKEACSSGALQVGKMLVVKEHTALHGDQYIINFPTKKEWTRKSQYSYIEDGLVALVAVIREYGIKSIAIPPLGCGNGGLSWEKVKPMMEKYLAPLEDVEVLVYSPDETVQKKLQQEGNKNEGVSAKKHSSPKKT